jgi:hypothetical protein
MVETDEKIFSRGGETGGQIEERTKGEIWKERGKERQRGT